MSKARRIVICMIALAAGNFIGLGCSARADQTLALREGWKLQSGAKITADGVALSSDQASTDGWYNTTVPRTVLAALVDNGVCPDPYYGDNLTKAPGYRAGRWMVMPAGSPFRDPWWYRIAFDVPAAYAGQRLTLCFDGINYRANLWLNGRKIADAKDVVGMFRRFRFDVTDTLKPGQKNYLAVEIIGPAQGEEKPYRTKQIEATTGWDDHNPQPPDANMGIWENVYLKATGPVAVCNPYVLPDLEIPSLAKAALTVSAQLVNLTDQPVQTELQGKIEDIRFAKRVSLEPKQSLWVEFAPKDYPQLVVAKPRVWWPNPMGPQELYRLELTAAVDGKVSDTAGTRFGIRKATTVINAEGWRKYQVNGKDVLIRGGAWMTCDMLLRFSHRRYDALVRYAKEANLNMLRSEGFSIRETDEFYDLCDEHGVMVTQQLFGRSIPDEPLAVACVEDTILRIRNHPSLVHFLGHDETYPTPSLDKAYRGLIDRFIPDRTYQPHSGAFNVGERFETGGTRTGTRELWTLANPSKYYTGKADGAWGFAQSGGIGGIIAPYESIRRMLPEKDRWPATNPVWSLHTVIQGVHYFDALFKQLDARYGPSDGIRTFSKKAMMLNYECARAMFEAYGRQKYSATGITTWKYDAAWPAVMTWQYVDWYLNVGGAYYGAKKACETLHVQYSYDDESIWVVNGRYEDIDGLRVTARLLGNDLSEKGRQSATVRVAADGHTRAFVLKKPKDLSKLYFLKLTLEDNSDKLVSDNFYWLSTSPETPGKIVGDWDEFSISPRSVPDYTALDGLPPVKLDVAKQFTRQGPETVAAVTVKNPSDKLAFAVHLAITQGKGGNEIGPTYWQDNYFSLLPGEQRTVEGRIATEHLEGAEPILVVDGWNVE
jgi:exo-1,4-beta-D-glucosaminidase